jgi:hypothetical protein
MKRNFLYFLILLLPYGAALSQEESSVVVINPDDPILERELPSVYRIRSRLTRDFRLSPEAQQVSVVISGNRVLVEGSVRDVREMKLIKEAIAEETDNKEIIFTNVEIGLEEVYPPLWWEDEEISPIQEK